MRRILYLHGLETPQGGEKVEYLTQNNLVYAPKVDYKNTKQLEEIFEDAVMNPFNLIIGSSIGGAFAYKIAKRSRTPIIVFNPAVHSTSIKLPKFSVGYGLKAKGFCVLGGKDDVIPMGPTLNILKDENLTFITVEEMTHRVSFKVFVDIYNKYSENEKHL